MQPKPRRQSHACDVANLRQFEDACNRLFGFEAVERDWAQRRDATTEAYGASQEILARVLRMEHVSGWLVPAGVIIVCFALAVVLRRVRLATLQRWELNADAHDELRVRLLDYVKRHSYQLGRWVDLAPFWKSERVRRDGDRFAVLAPLLQEAVLLVPVPTSGIDAVAYRVANWVGLELPGQVQLPEIVFRRMCQGDPLVIEQMSVAGDWVLGNQDKSWTGGNRVAGNYIGGDNVGRDKAGRDAHGISAAGSVANSGNIDSVHDGNVQISTLADLHDALSEVAAQAQARGEDPAVVAALRWAAGSALSGDQPYPQDLSKHQRTLDRAGEWLQGILRSVAESAAGALAGHWLMDILRG